VRHSSSDYELIDQIALQLRMDYGFLTESIDVFDLARKIGIVLTPYSKLKQKQLSEIKNKPELKDGFTIMSYENGVMKSFVFYNDNICLSRQRFTIAHEIKHVVFMEYHPNEKEEDLANHFARFILAPTCMVLKYKDESPFEVASIFDISFEAACYALRTARNRFAYNDDKLRDYEILFLEEVNGK